MRLVNRCSTGDVPCRRCGFRSLFSAEDRHEQPSAATGHAFAVGRDGAALFGQELLACTNGRVLGEIGSHVSEVKYVYCDIGLCGELSEVELAKSAGGCRESCRKGI
jgi:hypothetical protein